MAARLPRAQAGEGSGSQSGGPAADLVVLVIVAPTQQQGQEQPEQERGRELGRCDGGRVQESDECGGGRAVVGAVGVVAPWGCNFSIEYGVPCSLLELIFFFITFF